MNKRLSLILVLILVALLALLGYVASGPYRTVQAIREAVVAQDAAALSRQVDFPALRSSLKAQLQDRIARRFDDEMRDSLFGVVAMGLAGTATDAAVETMVTPLGLGAVMEGRKTWDNLRNGIGGAPPRPPVEPLHDPDYRFESTSRFTATVPDDDGRPVVFVLTRYGLDWKLSDIRLPPAGP